MFIKENSIIKIMNKAPILKLTDFIPVIGVDKQWERGTKEYDRIKGIVPTKERENYGFKHLLANNFLVLYNVGIALEAIAGGVGLVKLIFE